ncbi:protein DETOXIFICATION 49-like [Andrographis paniculata]|uniref:protein DETOXIFICATION 49-like n=1 Tax=Andrographis paniculata TaxID=175694 RepID=UPI0021E8F12A|nr:protein DETOXIFICATION 49-like [Andrographis paniculata]
MFIPLLSKPQTWQENDETTKKSTLFLALNELNSIANIGLPMILTGLVLYARSMISMLFLGRLGNDLTLAGGTLALGFANITGYSILSGFAMGMEPICGQAFGAQRFKLVGVTLQRTILLLLLASIPIAFLWMSMKGILILCGHDRGIATEAEWYILFSIPDLISQSFLHPLRIYLRAQSVTLPLTCCASLAVLLHIPINYYLVVALNLGIKGVALAGVWTNANLVAFLIAYIVSSGIYEKTWGGLSYECFQGWGPLMRLAIPSCISVCLEWWWYEIMILLCGVLINPRATIASMGILIQTTSLIYIFPSSLSFGVSTRVGNELGANRPNRAKVSAVVGLCISFVMGFSALLFALSVRNKWGGLFTKDEEIMALTSSVLPVIGLCELGNCPQTTGCGVLRGSARPKMGANINLGCFYIVGMPVAVMVSLYLGYDFKGLWMGLLAAEGCCAVAMLFVLVRTDWEFEALKAKDLTSFTTSEQQDQDQDQYQDDSFEYIGMDHHHLLP